MKNSVKVILALVIASQLTGCASYLSYRSSVKGIATKRVMASGHQGALKAMNSGVPAEQALKAFTFGEDGIGLAVDISNMDAIKEHPYRQLGAGFLDLGTGWGIGEIYKSIKEHNDNDDDDGYGSGVNVAARIEGLAEPGGVCIYRNAYGQIQDKLDLGYEYLGDHNVKNIKHPVRVYKVLMGSDDAGKLI